MGRLAIIVLAVFWATVTVGSLVWEVADPASLSTDQRQEDALPSGLSGKAHTAAGGEPTLAELAPELRSSLREQIEVKDTAAGQPGPTPPATAGNGARKPVAAAAAGAVVAPVQPGAQKSEPAALIARRPRPRPEQVVAPLAATEVKKPPARPGAPEPHGDPRGEPRIAEAQMLLSALGYRVGSADGRVGPQTKAAIKAYEKKGGFKVNGRVDDQLLARLRTDVRTARRDDAKPAVVGTPPSQSLAGRVLGGVQRLIGHDFNSATAPDKLAAYCSERGGDEWIYDRGLDRMRSCADIAGGSPKVAFRPLPGDR